MTIIIIFYIFVQSIAHFMDEKFTIHDIARILKVSPSTVSRALNDNPRISHSKREEIQKLAREKGYNRNKLAYSLRLGKTQTAGVIIPRITRAFFSNVIGGLEEVLRTAGFNLIICQTEEDYVKEAQNLKTLVNMQVDVIFLSLSAGTVRTDHLNEIINSGKRLIMFDRVDEKLGIETVKLNDYQGAFDSVQHMLDQGYRKIIHFGGPENLSVYKERKQGYIDALKANNISYIKVIPDIITRESGRKAFLQVRKEKNLPDGIFAASDFSALGAILSARDLNLKIPEDIGIAGFANEPFTEYVYPGITSTDQKGHLMGQRIAELFLNDPNGNKKHSETISPELIIRKSTLKNNL
ncbi:MAG: LacI family DNA-binding transcriptional regulator [Bacteroidota bacterium]